MVQLVKNLPYIREDLGLGPRTHVKTLDSPSPRVLKTGGSLELSSWLF